MSKAKTVKGMVICIPFVFSIVASISGNHLPLTTYSIMSIVTFGFYWFDKQQAIKEKSRIRERTLHLLEVFGGWPGGLLAQLTIFHKNKKIKYQFVFWLIVVLHILAWYEATIFDWKHFTPSQSQEQT